MSWLAGWTSAISSSPAASGCRPCTLARSLADILADGGLSAYALAKRLNVPLNRITAILAGKRAITADTALRLARFFDTSAEIWMRLQVSHELETTRADHGHAIVAEITPLPPTECIWSTRAWSCWPEFGI